MPTVTENTAWRGESAPERKAGDPVEAEAKARAPAEGTIQANSESRSREARAFGAAVPPDAGSDEKICADVNKRLGKDVHAQGIHVEVKNGDVTLRGTVNDQETKTAAEAVVRQAEGVKELINLLRIKLDDSSH